MLMRYILIGLFVFTAMAQEQSVTVYNNNMAIIKQKYSVSLKGGQQSLEIDDVASGIIPQSVLLMDAGFTILEQNYDYDLLSGNALLSKYKGEDITVYDENQSYRGQLLSVDGNHTVVLQTADKGIVMLRQKEDSRIEFSHIPKNFKLKPTLTWFIEGKRSAKESFELVYKTEGMSWKTKYIAVLDENDDRMQLSAWINLNNQSGKDYVDATLKCVAGDLNRNRPQRQMRDMRPFAKMATSERTGITERAFFEYYLYEVPRPVTIRHMQEKQIQLFADRELKVQKKYTFEAGRNKAKTPVNIALTFMNTKKNNLGMALPYGEIDLYKNDRQSMELIGEEIIKHTPRGEKLELNVGRVFDVLGTAKRVRTRKLGSNANEETFKVEIRNRKDIRVTVIVSHDVFGEWSLEDSEHPSKVVDDEIIFEVTVDKNSTKAFTYSIMQRF
jgi:hypothetical protein